MVELLIGRSTLISLVTLTQIYLKNGKHFSPPYGKMCRMQEMICKTAYISLHQMAKLVELHEICYKTATFSLHPMAKCVDFQEINYKM